MLFAFKKGGTSADEMEEKKLSFPPILRDWLNVDVDSLKLMFDLVPVREFPRLVDGGAPAGVVDMLLKGLWGLSGVEGGLDSGNLNILCGTSSEQVVSKVGGYTCTKTSRANSKRCYRQLETTK